MKVTATSDGLLIDREGAKPKRSRSASGHSSSTPRILTTRQ